MKLTPVLLLLCVYLSTICVHAESLVPEKDQYANVDIRGVLVELEKKMSGIQTLQTSFIQEKELAIFEQKIILEGMLFFQKPALLAWHVRKPVRHSTIINGEMIRQWDEETKQVNQISLIDNPIFGAAIAQMRMWFLGTYVELLSDYKITIRSQNPLILEFIPRDTTATHEVISQIIVIFREDQRYINQMRIEEKNGDNTQFTFVDTKLNISIKPMAWEVKSRVQ